MAAVSLELEEIKDEWARANLLHAWEGQFQAKALPYQEENVSNGKDAFEAEAEPDVKNLGTWVVSGLIQGTGTENKVSKVLLKINLT